VDIRSFPGSRKHPHFGRENLAATLPGHGIDYHWLEALGGRRHKKKTDPPSPNPGLRDQSFRNYADYMLTDDFRQGAAKLMEIAADRSAAWESQLARPVTGASSTWLESEGRYRDRCVSQRKRPSPQEEGEGQETRIGN
jgi:hypothetical protein